MAWYSVLIILLLIAMVGLLSWFAVKLTKKLLFLSENIDWIFNILDELKVHLETIHSMETFYGEPIIQNLIRHTKNVAKQIQDFKNIYSLEEDTEGSTTNGELPNGQEEESEEY